jgi:cytochrome P450
MSNLNQPMPPRSFWFGHIPLAFALRRTTPKDLHAHAFLDLVRRKYNLEKAFYLDTWPFDRPVLVVLDVELANIVTTKKNLDKDPAIEFLLGPILGPDNILTDVGAKWKATRSIFNPGFSSAHLMSIVPMIVDHTETYYDIMKTYAAEGTQFLMEDAAMRYTVDIIGRVTLDIDFNTQRLESQLVTTLRNQVQLLPKPRRFNPIPDMNPIRFVQRRRNQRIMNTLLGSAVDVRFATIVAADAPQKSRVISDLALRKFITKNPELKARKTLDSATKEYIVSQ